MQYISGFDIIVIVFIVFIICDEIETFITLPEFNRNI